MKFLHPGWFWVLLALVPIFAALLWDERGRKERFKRFAAEPTWKVLAPEIDFNARIRKAVFWTIAAAFAIVALARPQWGTHEETTKLTGYDVMFVLDLSNSMQVEDAIPSRLMKAKHLIKSMVDRLGGDRVGLVTFGASAAVSCPLTTDSNYMLGVLQMMSPAMVATQGTDIGLGLETARRAMDRGGEESAPEAGKQDSHAIVLISDGEDWEDAAIDEAKKIKEDGDKLYIFGVGSEKGGPIPVRDETGALETYKKDRRGQPIISTFHSDTLQQIASAAGGHYWNASDNEAELDEWIRMLNGASGLKGSDFGERTYLVFEDRFQYPLLIAVLFLLFEMVMPARKILPPASREGGVKSLLLLPLAFALLAGAGAKSAQAEPLNAYMENEKGIQEFKAGKVDEAKKDFGSAQAVLPDAPELLFNEGVVQLQQGDAENAAQAFQGAAARSVGKNPKLAGRSFFNLGEALSKKGDFKGAARSYAGAIHQAQLIGDQKLEADARKNIELLAQQKQKQQQQKQQQKQDQQQQNQKDQKDQGGKNQADNKNQQNDKDKSKNQDQNKDKDQQKEQADHYKDEEQQQFQSQKLRPEDADRVMEELRHEERELEAKLNKKNAQSQTSLHDW